MINNLYYNSDDAPSWGLEIDDDLLASALASIYNRDYNPRKEIDPDLFRGVVDRLDEAITEGIADDEPDTAFVDALRHSAEVFAAFKVHKAQNDMAARLLDSTGRLKSFEQWSNDVQSIASHQFGPWLRTEYDTAVIRAHQAAEWQRFERDKDVLPNLRWVPSTSPNPGADHRIYWGTILPVDHPFWSRHRPGDRWNCQCSLESTDEPATGIKHEDAVDPRKDGPHKGLGDNPGKSGSLFGQDHPYYPDSCSSCPFAGGLKNRLGMIFRGQRRDCNRCKDLLAKLPSITGEERRAVARALFEEYSNNPEYTDVRLNDELGCVTATHNDHNFDKRTGHTEKAVRDVGYKNGHSVIFGKEGSGVIGERFTEGLWDGMPFEVASRETATDNNVLKGLYHCASKRKTEVAILYYPNGGYDEEILNRALIRYRGIKDDPNPKRTYIEFKRVVCIGGGKILYDQPFEV